jgi:hypothetical protein
MAIKSGKPLASIPSSAFQQIHIEKYRFSTLKKLICFKSSIGNASGSRSTVSVFY